MKTVSIIVPCYFNEANIAKTYEVLNQDVLTKRKDIKFELIFVDDGSKDSTLLELRKVQQIDNRVRIIKLSKNFGEFRAILAGMTYSTGDCIAVMSADLQDPPYLITRMIEEWEKGEKVVIAARSSRLEGRLKTFFAHTYYWILRKLVIEDYPKYGFDFFLLDRQVANILIDMKEKNSTIYVQVIWTGFKPKIIEYVRQERVDGKSMWSYWKRINLFIDTFIVFSYKPIRFISFLGILMSLFGFASAIYFILERVISGVQVQGWTSLVVAVLVLAGVQLIMLGIIGEYIWRNLDETRKRPVFIVDEVFEFNSSNNQ